MKLQKTGRIAIAGLAVVAALGMSACGDDKKDSEAKPSKVSTSAKAPSNNPNLPPTPTVAELNALLQRALDTSVPSSQKQDLVQGIQADPELPNRLAEAYKQSGATTVVTEVTQFGDTLNAKAKLTLNGQENVADVPFVVEDGKWKVQKTWACAGLTNLGQTSPACA
ncbi:hypothetical protein [Nocardia sp. NPDC052566]|uniref:hypothetical protein n=1 Tax=Nocardia sp. NPDC052566 TaxID=3364330 RepID=UPI0037CBF571